jgi:hypothetical protein
MDKNTFKGYAASLEQILRNTHFDLREAMDQLQGLCFRVTRERTIPLEIIPDIHKTYREIQDHLSKINGIRQLLEGKYRQYYRRDCMREREITEYSFLAKSLYLKLEFTLKEIETKRRLKDRRERSGGHVESVPFRWFQSKENQVALLRNLKSLYELAYKTPFQEKRQVIQKGLRSVSLFVLAGEVALIDNLQSHIRLREYDIKERYTKDELRGALTHLNGISLPEVERIIRRFTHNSESMKLKCLLFSIQSQRDLEKEIIGSAENILHGITEGEVRMLSI